MEKLYHNQIMPSAPFNAWHSDSLEKGDYQEFRLGGDEKKDKLIRTQGALINLSNRIKHPIQWYCLCNTTNNDIDE